jgi:hypothetical protein
MGFRDAMRQLAILLPIALATTCAVAPPAGAHGGEELGGEVAEGTDRGHVVGSGRFTTTRRHHRLYVRVCIQRWRGGRDWDTRGCERTVARSAKTRTIDVDVRCASDGIYRVRVWGSTKTRAGGVRHRVRGKSLAYSIDC